MKEKDRHVSWRRLLAGATGLLMLPGVLLADEPGFLGQPSSLEREAKVHGHDDGMMDWTGLTGDWGGNRGDLEESGVTFEAVYTGEVASSLNAGAASGKKESMYLDNTDVTFTLDTEKAGMWPGGTLFIYGLGNNGRDPSGEVFGDLQTASNIEAPNDFLLYEAWYEQKIGDALSVLVGFHDMNSEFDVSEYGSLFLNSSPGVGAEISGNVALSIFAKTGLAVRVHVDPTDNWYIQAAAYDGDPATRALNSNEGKMYIVESGVSSDSGTYKVAYWKHTADIVFNGKNFNDDSGYYIIADQKLIDLGDDRAVGAYARWGAVPSDRNEVISNIQFGLHTHGLVAGRGEDDFGIAYIKANTQNSSETVIELTYRAVFAPWFAIQPSLQRIENPGANSANAAVNVALLRFELAL